MKKQQFNFSNLQKFSLKDILNEISTTASVFSEFNKNINAIHLKPEDYSKYGSILLKCASSYYENKEDSSKPIKKLIRSDTFNTIHVIDVYTDSMRFWQKNDSMFPVLLGIDKSVWYNNDIEVRKFSCRKKFLQYAIQSLAGKKHSNFFLSGPINSGKTFLATQYLKMILNKNPYKTIAFVNWNQWILDYRSTFNSLTSSSDKRRLDKIIMAMKTADFLIIDDFALPRPSEWEREALLLPIIKHRNQNCLCMGIISSLNLNELLSRINPGGKNSANKNGLFSLDNFEKFYLKNVFEIAL